MTHYLTLALIASLTISPLTASAQIVRSEYGAAKTRCGFNITLQTKIKNGHVYVSGATTKRTDLEVLENNNILRRECVRAMKIHPLTEHKRSASRRQRD